MNVLRIEARIVGVLRILRLIKVIIEMKKAADEQRERQEIIKQQKKQGSQMASYVEKVIDMLEKCAKNQDVPKVLREDIEWAIEVISSNKLYKSNLGGFKLSNEREDVQAWNNLINLSASLINNHKQGGGEIALFSNEMQNSNKSPAMKRSNTDLNLLKHQENNKDELARKRNTAPMRLKASQDEFLEIEIEDQFFELINETDKNIYETL